MHTRQIEWFKSKLGISDYTVAWIRLFERYRFWAVDLPLSYKLIVIKLISVIKVDKFSKAIHKLI